MGGWVDSEEAKILDAWTGKTAYTPPTWYFALSTTLPTADTGANFTEPVAGGYLRFQLTASNWTAATAGNPSSTSYGAVATFPQATGGWGTLSYGGIFSVATPATGLPTFWFTLTNAKCIQTSDTASYAANTVINKLGDPPDTY